MDRKLTMKGLLDTSFSRPSILVGYKLALGFVMYLPAMLYRWNLKASAWLWWPLALILSAPFGGKSEVAKWDAIAVTTQGYWASKREWAVFLVGAWLVTTFISPAHIKELGFLKNLDEAIKVSSWLPPPSPTTLRYWLLWLWVTLQFWLHKRAVDYRAIGAKPGEDLKAADATRRVASLVVIGRIAQSVTATYVLIVWTLGLWFAQEHWPHLFRSSVWGWLRPWL